MPKTSRKAPEQEKTKAAKAASEPVHGLMKLPSVVIEGYSLELRDHDGFVGDQASQTAFRALLDNWRKRKRKRHGKDPLGKVSSDQVAKSALDAAIHEKKASEASDMVHAAIEEFAIELAQVIRRFLRQKSWRKVQRIVLGGGFPGSGVGERAVLQASAMLHHEGRKVELARLSHETDDGGLIGWVHLVPRDMLKKHDAFLAVDIGGTNVRCGLVKTRFAKARDLSRAEVVRRHKWRHADDGPQRKDLLQGIVEMLHELSAHARKKRISLAPFVGIACPGLIREDGSIARGVQNLPGDWASETFHLPTAVAQLIPTIGQHETLVLMHNDAVVQGLSELPFMQDVKRWGVLTIGTGLGNASYTNRKKKK
ncbi:ROK family protein [Variovorax sp. J22R133]|uniref:ROK family protein n=1 Tax=Variovorax brevis TaxID=3053503 RepID=UPI002574B138|nr:ROK family protein [Variovorax sp. J22R133]MDM0113246.1 ROK family protein [Variovorax sp. J22R133]